MLENRASAKSWPRRSLRHLGLLILGWLVAVAVAGAQERPLALFPFTVDANTLQGAPDASDLNRPLAQADRIIVHDGQFWRSDLSERIRFFGVNLSFAGNFPSSTEAGDLARRLRGLGFNAVRLHHLDTLPSNQSPPSSILKPGPYPDFNEDAVRRLKNLIQALVNEGLYINLNLRVGYVFRPGTDAVPFYDPGRMSRAIGSPILVYHPRMQRLQEQYARELIERLGLRNHPGLAMVEINNESSLLAAWQRREWRDAIPGEYGQLLRAKWQDWLADRYGSIAAACAHWGDCDSSARAGELPQPDDPVAGTALEAIHNSLASKLSQWWGARPGLAMLGDNPPAGFARLRDFMLFLAETDQTYFERMRHVVQAAAGFPVPVTGTQMNYGGILNLTSQVDMDYIDDHFYIDHPHFLEGSSNVRNWRIWNVSLTNRYMDTLLQRAFRREAGKPFVMSELNHPYPSLPSAEFLPIMAAFALLQDWDGLFFYDYDGGRQSPVAPAGFGLRGDWGKYVTVSQVARWFRQDGIAPLQTALDLPLDITAQAAVSARGRSDALANLLRERQGVLPRHAWTYRLGIDTSPGAQPVKPHPEQGLEGSPDGTLVFDRDRGVLEIISAPLLGYMGPQPGSDSLGEGLNIRLNDGAPHHAAVLLTSLDAQPIRESRRLLLTLGSATLGSQPEASPSRPKSFVRHPAGDSSWTLEPDPGHLGEPSGSRDATGPAWLTRNEGTVSWPSVLSDIVVYPLDGAGRRMPPLPAARLAKAKGRIMLEVQRRPEETSPWYEIVALPSGHDVHLNHAGLAAGRKMPDALGIAPEGLAASIDASR
ncbi:MAG: capsular biosynthesis protein [Pigmentiphaga sp.]